MLWIRFLRIWQARDYWSVAVLPDAKPSTIAWFEKVAFAFVTETRVEYRYDPQSAKVTTNFSATTEVKEGANAETVFALYRHQHLHVGGNESTCSVPICQPSRDDESRCRKLVFYRDAVSWCVAVAALYEIGRIAKEVVG